MATLPDLSIIESSLAGHRLVRDVTLLDRGQVRLETCFLYPDGSSIDVFIVQEQALSLFPSLKVSDLGQTTAWLLDLQVKPWLSKKRLAMLEDALRTYQVSRNGGALEVPLESLDQLTDAVVRLGQACIRVADLTYTRRSSLQVSFVEEVEEVLSDAELVYESGRELTGKYGKVVRVDFLVTGRRTQSAVLTLGSGNTSQAHTMANEVFRRWYDLTDPSRREHKVTLFDDRMDVYRDDDLSRLRDLSILVALSDRQAVVDLLAA